MGMKRIIPGSRQPDSQPAKLLFGFAAAVGLALLAGCIADTAEDTDLPWSSSKSWEGMAPVAPSMMDRYE